MPLSVRASRPSSSFGLGACSRRSSRLAVISSAVAAIRSTGASALRASRYPPPSVHPTARGPARSRIASSSPSCLSFSAQGRGDLDQEREPARGDGRG